MDSFLDAVLQKHVESVDTLVSYWKYEGSKVVFYSINDERMLEYEVDDVPCEEDLLRELEDVSSIWSLVFYRG